ncbi:endosialin [Erinaceus europaeus]|uniref:Endosialin n=1 Tax=Erinaceus europaeus TaxID=9365 RepID=A0A1S2ZG29_ERIEU|nr:endosialin [Erinaceus europaeus]
MLLRLLLAWAASVPALGQAPWAAEPRATCGLGRCYALFPRRRTFLDAWRACRELGGDLATPRTPEEARQVDSLVEGNPAGGLLWIGLQRQPRQCQPQRPLRGFTWTTGDQDTAFTNWAQPATGAPCPAQRCAALEAVGTHRWVEGSCTLAVDGYLCQFGFEGSCPALPEEEGQAGPAVYTTPFHLVSTRLEWLPFGSVAAVPCSVGSEASLLCMKQPDGSVVWSRAGPLCPPTSCDHNNGGCEHECVEEPGGLLSCRCAEGFRLAADGRSCQDPCAQAPCEQQCEPGGPLGYRCHCRLGFRPAEDDPHHCVDTDECRIPGVCQQMCVNYIGGFECYCSEGHELEADGISCSPAGATGSRASQGLEEEENEEDEEQEEKEEEEEEEEEESWENYAPSWTEGPGIPWMDGSQTSDFGLASRPGFSEDRELLMSHLDPTGPSPLSPPRGPYHSEVLSVTRPAVALATHPPLLPSHWTPRVPARHPALPSAHHPIVISATGPPLAPVHRTPRVPARHPALHSAHQPIVISATGPPLAPAHQTSKLPTMVVPPIHQAPSSLDLSSSHQSPLISTKSPSRPPAHHSPMSSDTHMARTQFTPNLPPIPANHTPLVTTANAHQPPTEPEDPVIQAWAPHIPLSSTAQPPLTTTSTFPAPSGHEVSVPAATQSPASPNPLSSQSPTNQTSPIRTTHSHPRAADPTLAPRQLTPEAPTVVPTAAPTALGEASLAGRSRRDDRWLLVALLVPTCIFLVVLLALGIVYCTRCGPHAPNKRVTDCYRWVTQAGSKGPTDPTPHRGSLTGVQTCRTSV